MNKWYFCINERGFKNSIEMIKVAVGSARKNTTLIPHCIYNGHDQGHIDALTQLGVNVIRHISTFSDELKTGYGDQYDTFSGHWLRVDIPLIAKQENYVLYTDTDVMFLQEPVNDRPELISGAPEFDKSNLTYFNSGVLVMNIPNLLNVRDEFIGQIKSRLTGDFRFPAHDQESFNRFFKGKFKNMAPEMNWKPFWGLNDNARIIHFHGPKPAHAHALSKGQGEKFMPIYKKLWSDSPGAYELYSDLYSSYK